jgi:hypothetical protein
MFININNIINKTDKVWISDIKFSIKIRLDELIKMKMDKNKMIAFGLENDI